MHKLFQNRYLSTASFLLAPRDPPGGGAQDDQNGSDTNDDGDNAGQDQSDAEAAARDAGGDDGADDQGDGDAGDDDEGNADGADDDDADEDDEDPDLADLPPEARAKAKAAIARRIAKETGWRDRQIERLHGKRRQAEEDVRAASEIVQPHRAAAAAAAAELPANATAAQIEERAKIIAANMTATERYDEACNDADAKGRAAYGDKWAPALAKLPKLGGLDVTDMQDILATDQPHVVMVQLSDPDTYERVMGLPPARRRNEFVKLSLKEAPKPKKVDVGKTSKRPGDAPPPVRPLGNGRRVAAQRVDLYDDKADDDAWYKARNETRRKKFTNIDA